jgi:ATPase subunit of ABC transporter with duplicated ATPase domains
VIVGELDQARRAFAGTARGERTVVEIVCASSALLPDEARTLLAKFGLKAAHVDRAAGSLSPGERTRAGLALLMANQTNCLVLDEPTNHLDLAAIEQLEEAVSGYGGTLLLVTHDRRLLQAVPTKHTIEVAGGRVRQLN